MHQITDRKFRPAYARQGADNILHCAQNRATFRLFRIKIQYFTLVYIGPAQVRERLHVGLAISVF